MHATPEGGGVTGIAQRYEQTSTPMWTLRRDDIGVFAYYTAVLPAVGKMLTFSAAR